MTPSMESLPPLPMFPCIQLAFLLFQHEPVSTAWLWEEPLSISTMPSLSVVADCTTISPSHSLSSDWRKRKIPQFYSSLSFSPLQPHNSIYQDCTQLPHPCFHAPRLQWSPPEILFSYHFTPKDLRLCSILPCCIYTAYICSAKDI